MAAGRCGNLTGSVRRERSVLFAVCQVVSHNNFRKFIVGVGARYALSPIFSMLLRRKNVVPFSRPCGATENDAHLESGDVLW